MTVQGIGVEHLDDLSASADVDWIKCSISAHESSEQNRDRDSGGIPVKTLTLTGKVPQRTAGRVHARVELKGGGHTVSLPVFVDLRPVIRVFPTLSVLGTSRQETTEHRIIPSPGLSLSADSVRLDFENQGTTGLVRTLVSIATELMLSQAGRRQSFDLTGSAASLWRPVSSGTVG